MLKVALCIVVSCVTTTPRIVPHQETHPSIVSKVLATYRPPGVESATPKAMARAATRFLEALSPELRAQAALGIESPERKRWTNVPPGNNEGGVRLGDCGERELRLACDLLAAVLSRQGYERVRNILLADDRLLKDGKPRRGFGAENFWLAIFGAPSEKDLWALQLDGHHVAVNMTFKGDRVGLSPTFIGTQPATFRIGNLEIIPLHGHVHEAFSFAEALTQDQRKIAISGSRRGQIVAGADRDGVVPKPEGLPCKGLDAAQRRRLMSFVRQYVGDLPEPYATRRMDILEAEIDSMWFSWRGPLEAGSDVSYRLQGPTLIIEFACQDLGGNPLQHLHSMYRDPTNEYGAAFAK